MPRLHFGINPLSGFLIISTNYLLRFYHPIIAFPFRHHLGLTIPKESRPITFILSSTGVTSKPQEDVNNPASRAGVTEIHAPSNEGMGQF